MPLEVTIIKRPPTAVQFWDMLQRLMPKVLGPVAVRMQARAPRGKTGKLSRRIDLRVVRVNAGLIQGLQVDFVTGVPYGHLVERGHRIIARGPQRKGQTLTRAVRKQLRSALLQRRAAGGKGFVPGVHFALRSFQEARGEIVQGLEARLRQEVDRAV